jgi:nicotinic acid mononucleotide adenylyltransferase
MGADSWSEITTWRDWERLLTLINHVVVSRPGHDLEEYSAITDRVVDLRGVTDQRVQVDPLETKVFLTDIVMKDISATRIRELASVGEFARLTELVTEPVANYIRKYRIYQE